MLALIWSQVRGTQVLERMTFSPLQEKTIKDAVVAAYKRLYINVESNNSRNASTSIAQNLIALVVGESHGRYTFPLEV